LNPSKTNLKFHVSLLILLALLSGALWIVSQTPDSARARNPQPPNMVKAKSIRATTPAQSVSTAPPKSTNQPASFKEIYQRSSKNASFAIPLSEEIDAFESLLNGSIKTSFAVENLQSHWRALGWNLQIFPDRGFVVIEEVSAQRRGRGLYAFRIAAVDPVMLQAPHRFFDTDTGVISRQLFEDKPIQAAAWNTVHRKEYDMAHRSRGFLNAFTRTVVKQYPSIVNFQIHGFDASKHGNKNGESTTTLAIISNGTRSPDRMTKDFTLQMKASFGKDRVWLFPLETGELGATKNVQASVMRHQGSAGFLHVELAKEFRDRLVGSRKDRTALYDVFAATTPNQGGLAKTREPGEAKPRPDRDK